MLKWCFQFIIQGSDYDSLRSTAETDQCQISDEIGKKQVTTEKYRAIFEPPRNWIRLVFNLPKSVQLTKEYASIYASLVSSQKRQPLLDGIDGYEK